MESQYYLALMVTLSVLLYAVGTHLAWAYRPRRIGGKSGWSTQDGWPTTSACPTSPFALG